MHRRLGRLDGQAVHDLHRPGQEPGGDHPRHGVARALQRRVGGQHGAIGLGTGNQPDRDLERDAEQALRADEQAGQIGPGLLHAVAAQPHHFAVGQHDLEAEHVVGGHPVAEAVGAAGVEGDVAADGAHRLARRVGRVVEAVRLAGGRDVEVDHAGLDDGDPVERVDPQDAVHPVEGDHDALLDRHRAARQAGARPAGHEGHAGGMTETHGLHDFGLRLRQHHGARPGAEGREPVALVRRQRGRARQQPVGRVEPSEIRQQIGHDARPL